MKIYDYYDWEKDKQIEKKLLEKRKNSSKGILHIKINNNDIIIPYQYTFVLNNIKIYVNTCLCGGQRVNELMMYLSGCVNGKYNDYDDINNFIKTWCKFEYKVIKYNEYYVMYVYNKMYNIDFNNMELSNIVDLKDIINNKYSDLD